jgi:2-C-methyl-D-erythritol 4-phosphate cytidylyltransferase
VEIRARSGAVAVVLAAGSGTRMGADHNKAYLPLGGRRMLSWSLASIGEVPELVRTILVIRPDDRLRAIKTLDREVPNLAVEIIDGGDSRHQSEYNALNYLAPDIESGAIDIVLIHDAARPLAGPGMMRSAIRVARQFGGAVPGVEAHDLVTVDSDGKLSESKLQARYVRVQTPQAFQAVPLLHAYREAAAEHFEGTDTSSSVEKFSDIEVRSFQGDPQNMKVTFSQDLFLAERLLANTHHRLK